MLHLRQKICKCGKKALPNRRVCWTCELANRRLKREASITRCKARRAKQKEKTTLSTKSLDSLWGSVTKAFYGNRCEHCGSPNNLNSHHVYRRTLRALRWDYRNCVVLCANCHMCSNQFSAHGTPLLFAKWFLDLRGVEWVALLKEKALKEPEKPEHFLIELHALQNTLDGVKI
jgi:hypothetical protein